MKEIKDSIKEILKDNPNYSAEQAWREMNRRVPLKEVVNIMIDLEVQRQNLVNPEKLNEFKRLLIGDVKCV